jgi:hypothetical protein
VVSSRSQFPKKINWNIHGLLGSGGYADELLRYQEDLNTEINDLQKVSMGRYHIPPLNHYYTFNSRTVSHYFILLSIFHLFLISSILILS